jgi:hypothetical protein
MYDDSCSFCRINDPYTGISTTKKTEFANPDISLNGHGVYDGGLTNKSDLYVEYSGASGVSIVHQGNGFINFEDGQPAGSGADTKKRTILIPMVLFRCILGLPTPQKHLTEFT